MNALIDLPQLSATPAASRPMGSRPFHRSVIRLVKTLLRSLFSILPFPCSRFAVRHISRRFCHLLPAGHALTFSGYYKSLTVRIDTTYPIERQMFSGIYDSSTVRILEQFVRPGDVCIDAGANVGAITLVMGYLVGREGKVFAFEPGPQLFARLDGNLALNATINERVHTYQCGLSDEQAELRWEEDAANRGNAFLSRVKGSNVVPVKRLDEIPELHGERVRFVKIDVEGMELRVLRGAREMIARTRCLIYFEAMPGARRRKNEEDGEDIFRGLRDFFDELKYDVLGVTESGSLEPVQGLHFCQNNLAIPSELGRYSPSRVADEPISGIAGQRVA